MAMRIQWRVTMSVASFWVISLLYGEMIAFWVPLFSCSWPVLEFNGTKTGDAPVKPIKIAMIADPQITHKAGSGVSATTLKFSEFYSDIYMRRAFHSSVLEMDPDRILILGDLLEGGHLFSDLEWDAMHKRFEHVFDQSQRGSRKESKRVPVYYLSGSEDLGSTQLQMQRPEIRNRGQAAFGALEYVVPIGGLEFLFTNAKAFDGLEFSIKENITWGLLEKISSGDGVRIPRILLSASPLYKPSDRPCGAHVADKNDESVRQMPGQLSEKNPEEYLPYETTTRLLNLTKPMMVFSAHGRHGCSMEHNTPYGSIIEHTLGTFNWQQENLHPSFMMVSVAPESNSGYSDMVSTSICFLPAQTSIYTWYLCLFLTGLLAIFVWPAQGIDTSGALLKVCQYLREIFRPDSSVKVKDEDADNGDWEMMWDAEGGMHLVKAQKVVSSTKNTTKGGDRRGTAFARSAAKRQPELDKETLITVDSNPSDLRTTTAKTRMLPNRFWLALGPLAVLMSFSFSLYMMLLMKDWT